jgi:hypothetical protein
VDRAKLRYGKDFDLYKLDFRINGEAEVLGIRTLKERGLRRRLRVLETGALKISVVFKLVADGE